MSAEQHRLYNLMSEFAVETVLGWISNIYKRFGPPVVSGDALISIIIPFAEEYFNCCARWIYTKEDTHLNAKMDEMTRIQLKGENHPIDVLNHIVLLSLRILQNVDLRGAVGDSYEQSMKLVDCHLRAIAKRGESLAGSLNGCDSTHEHGAISPDTKVYSFTIDKHVDVGGRSVKLSTLD